MEKWTGFNSYDFFAYLPSGVLLLALLDHVLGLGWWDVRDSWRIPEGLLIIVGAYVAGHVVAALSYFCFEEVLMNHCVMPPNLVVMGLRDPRFIEKIFAKILGRSGFEKETEGNRKLVKKIFKNLNKEEVSEKNIDKVTKLGRKYVQSDDESKSRLLSFQNLSGFCRNMAMTSIIAILLLIWKIIENCESIDILYLVVSIILLLVFALRYIKFQYSHRYELLRQIWQKNLESESDSAEESGEISIDLVK